VPRFAVLAFKWTRILFRCWQDRVVYDENTYMTKLALRGSPLVSAIRGAEAVNSCLEAVEKLLQLS
jgi:hypothetical protein